MLFLTFAYLTFPLSHPQSASLVALKTHVFIGVFITFQNLWLLDQVWILARSLFDSKFNLIKAFI